MGVQPTKSFKDKFDLSSELLPGITYRAIRDALNCLGHTFSSAVFGIELRKRGLLDLRAEERGWQGPYAKRYARMTTFEFKELAESLATETAHPEWREEEPRMVAALMEAIAQGEPICEAMARERIIEKEGGEWKLLDRGATLKAQKAIKRLPRAKAQELLKRVIVAAETFNSQEGPNWYITKLILFGSMLDPERPDVGDIDLIMDTHWRHADRKRVYEMECERMQKIRPSHNSMLVDTRIEAKKAIQLNNHVSIGSIGTLQNVEEKGGSARLLYVYTPPNLSEDDHQKWAKFRAEAEATRVSLF